MQCLLSVTFHKVLDSLMGSDSSTLSGAISVPGFNSHRLSSLWVYKKWFLEPLGMQAALKHSNMGLWQLWKPLHHKCKGCCSITRGKHVNCTNAASECVITLVLVFFIQLCIRVTKIELPETPYIFCGHPLWVLQHYEIITSLYFYIHYH